MLCKRIAPTLLALLLPLSLASLGCGGGDDVVPPPVVVLGSETDLSGLAISAGELAPAFGPSVKNYAVTMGYIGESSVGVTATLKDTKAKLRINNITATSGSRVNVPLDEGVNSIRLVVTAEDGQHSNTVTLNVNKLPFNTHVWVLNGIAGVPVENTVLTLTDNRGKVLADNVALPRAKNGKLVFGLDPSQKYNIYAKGDNAAAACFANFDPAKENSAELYCLRNSTTFLELEAPVIEDISFATTNEANANWKTMSNDAYYVGPLADVAAIRVTVLTRNLIAGSTDPSADIVGIPVRVNIDETASANTGAATGVTATAVSRNTPVQVGGKDYYRSVYRCALPLISTNIFSKEHYADIVVYDTIGNRTEQRVYLTITDSTNGVPTDPDLSGTTPIWNSVQAQTFTGGGDLAARPDNETNAMDPVDAYNGYQQVLTQFYVRATGTTMNLPIRGFEVWRSIGSANNLVRIATVNYATPTTGGPFQYVDRTPSLAAGDVYYRVRAFTGNPAAQGFSQFSPAIRTRVLPPTTTGPAPSHSMVSQSLWPTFRIEPSNALMFAKDAAGKYVNSDYFYFTLFVKDADTPYPFLLIPMQLRFTEADQIVADPNNPINQHRFGFKKGMPTAAFMYVTDWSTYEVSGDWYYACDETDDEDNPFEPFVYLDTDGSVVINTDSDTFREAIDNYVRYEVSGNPGAEFMPGSTYFWNLFGNNGGIFWNANAPLRWTYLNDANAAYFAKGVNTNGLTYLGCSYGSHLDYGLGSPAGWFTLTIAADAE